MSLYGDLPQAKDDGSSGSKGWASAASKLQPQARKAAGVLAPPPSLLRAGGRGPGPAGRTLPGRGAGRGGGGAGGRGGAAPSPHSAAAAAAAVGGGGVVGEAATASGGPIVVPALTFFSTHGEAIGDEYDPLRPNDYEDVLRDRDRKRKEAEEEAERVKRQREAEMVRWCWCKWVGGWVAWELLGGWGGGLHAPCHRSCLLCWLTVLAKTLPAIAEPAPATAAPPQESERRKREHADAVAAAMASVRQHQPDVQQPVKEEPSGPAAPTPNNDVSLSASSSRCCSCWEQ